MKVIWSLGLMMVIQLAIQVSSLRLRPNIAPQQLAEAKSMIQAMSFFDGIMKTMLEDFRSEIQEPFRVYHYNVQVAQDILNCSLKLDNITMDGISTYRIDSLVSSLFQKKTSAEMFLPQIKIKGHYDLKGVVDHFFPLYGNGDFYMELNGLNVNAAASVLLIDGFFKGIKDLDIDFSIQNLRIRFNGLMGHLSDVVNEFSSDEGTETLKKEWELHRSAITIQLQELINSKMAPKLTQLTQKDYSYGLELYQSYTSEVDVNINGLVDEILTNARQYIKDNNLDPIAIMDIYKSFSKKFLGIRWHGHISLTNGSLYGISTMQRTGSATLDYNSDKGISITAKLSVDALQATYQGEAKFMGHGPHFHLMVTAPHPSIAFEINVLCGSPPRITLKEFHIEDIGAIKIKVTGLGILDWLVDKVSELIVYICKGRIISKVETIVEDIIQQHLNDLKIPVPLCESLQRYYIA